MNETPEKIIVKECTKSIQLRTPYEVHGQKRIATMIAKVGQCYEVKTKGDLYMVKHFNSYEDVWHICKNGFLFFKSTLISERIPVWLELGNKNVWIHKATDPAFTVNSFCRCLTFIELIKNFEESNWCLGQAFYIDNLCFINQVNGGDEWLTIKEDLSFESISFGHMKPQKRATVLYRLEKATLEQCKLLQY